MSDWRKRKYNEIKERHKYEVEKDGEYEYIRSYFKDDILPNGKVITSQPYISIKHKYCGNIYEVSALGFINNNKRCGKCCQKYENSFAHHIEITLGELLEKHWDFEKNTVNPYFINKHMNYKNKKGENKKVWIKCQERSYHGSYEISCDNFINGYRCSYCKPSRVSKVHPKDSFAQYHIDNTDKDFLEKYWDYEKNVLDPFAMSPNNGNKVWIKCQEKEYHNSYEIYCYRFTYGVRCPYCHPSGKNAKIHPLDSFGYYNFDKVQSWHPDNNMSPFKVTPNSNLKYKFICEKCGNVFNKSLNSITQENSWCTICSMSTGEKEIAKWLRYYGIEFVYDEPYFKDLLSDKGNPLRPDFLIEDKKVWIEYDGEFHYKKMYDDDYYEDLKIHDMRKNNYAKNNGWKLIRIPYWEFDKIEEILKDVICKY
jgi:hypothetical protein